MDAAGERRVRTVCHAIQLHAPMTARIAKPVTHACALANNARRLPPPASTAAGNANGRTQHAPHATAPVASVKAASPAAFAPGCFPTLGDVPAGSGDAGQERAEAAGTR